MPSVSTERIDELISDLGKPLDLSFLSKQAVATSIEANIIIRQLTRDWLQA